MAEGFWEKIIDTVTDTGEKVADKYIQIEKAKQEQPAVVQGQPAPITVAAPAGYLETIDADTKKVLLWAAIGTVAVIILVKVI